MAEGKGVKSWTLPHPAKKAPVVSRDEKKGEVTVEVDKTKAKTPYRFYSYSTARKIGIAQTTFGGALLSLNSLTIQPETMFIEVYIFFIPGLLVIFGGSFAMRSTKVKKRRIRSCLTLTSVIFTLLGLLAALAVEARACMLLLNMTKLNIMLVLLQVVALGVVPVSILQMLIGLDSVFCGKHRPGYSMTLKVVYKVGKLVNQDVTDGQLAAEAEAKDTAENVHLVDVGTQWEDMSAEHDDVSTEETLAVQLQETLQIRDNQ